MNDDLRFDRAVRDALLPSFEPDGSGLALAIGTQIRTIAQHRRSRWPWVLGPAATRTDAARVRALRLALAVALVGAMLTGAAVGARLLRTAPPQLFVGRAGQLLTMPIEGGLLQPIRSFAGRIVDDVNVSPDSKRLLTMSAGVLELWDAASVLLDESASSKVIEAPTGTSYRDPGVWMPDSRSVLLPVNEHGATRLYLVDIENGVSRKVSPPGVAVGSFFPSPDGRQVALMSQRNSRFELYLVDLATGQSRVLVADDPDAAPSGDITWSPAGDQLAFTMLEGSSLTLWLVAADGSELRQISADFEVSFGPQWSYDARLIVYNQYAPGYDGRCNLTIFKLDVESGVATAIASKAGRSGG